MKRETRFVARCTDGEKELLAQVAQVMQRTPSDALRILVYEKARAFNIPYPQNLTAYLALDSCRIEKGIENDESRQTS